MAWEIPTFSAQIGRISHKEVSQGSGPRYYLFAPVWSTEFPRSSQLRSSSQALIRIAARMSGETAGPPNTGRTGPYHGNSVGRAFPEIEVRRSLQSSKARAPQGSTKPRQPPASSGTTDSPLRLGSHKSQIREHSRTSKIAKKNTASLPRPPGRTEQPSPDPR